MESWEADLHEMSLGITAWRAIAYALERDLELPLWIKDYLKQTAAGIDNWAVLNGHPGELKEVLRLQGKRKYDDMSGEPRWIYDAISQLQEQQPDATVKDLVVAYMKQFPNVEKNEENVRQKYYQGKRLAEKGIDYKGRGRVRQMDLRPSVAARHEDEPDF
ncbi:hypothetical protein D1012_10310 [Pseudotabrizicola alkalilacus]|uniref:Uncharacterized protein n=2 Tax=Pseudotabrizicola alkalilacus TaxID=2305252 RepID=A0A411Z3D3_9RHOB|nr:hypothetical protein D1012_10310 [Pseudotabrizicola alkalilacus]